MTRRWSWTFRLGAVSAVLSILVVACGGNDSGGSDGSPASGGKAGTEQLVIDTQFDQTTADPGRDVSNNGRYILGSVYDTLLTFKPDASGSFDLTAAPEPWLAESFEANEDSTEFTFKLRSGVVFSDGKPLTAKDVVFSLKRLKNLKAGPSFIGECFETVSAVDDLTVRITTNRPCVELPSLLALKASGVVNSEVVRKNGGSAAADAAETDTADQFFTTHSLGSGPYMLESFSTSGQTVLARNPKFWGEEPPYERLIFENVEPNVGRLNVVSGRAQIAMGLTGDQLEQLRGSEAVQVHSSPSTTLFYLQANADPAVSELSADPTFWRALRAAIDYEDLATLVGEGTGQACGVVPPQLLGALPENDCARYDLEAARGYVAQLTDDFGGTLPTVQLELPTDYSLNGVSYRTVAEALQGYFKEAGINVELKAAPIATWLPRWQKGVQPMNIGASSLSTPDPSASLVLAPTGRRGQYAGWEPTDAPEITELGRKASAALGQQDRIDSYHAFQRALNESSPIIPMFLPVASIVGVAGIGGLDVNPVYQFDPLLLEPGAG